MFGVERYMDISNEDEQNKILRLRDEVRKLKSELEEYKVEKSSEISALLAEKTFVWNQLKQMETTFKEQLRNKCDEVKNANKKVQILVSRADELQKSNTEIRADMTKMESESIRKDEEILELIKEVERLKSRSGSAPTLLRPCKADAASSSREAIGVAPVLPEALQKRRRSQILHKPLIREAIVQRAKLLSLQILLNCSLHHLKFLN